MGRQRYPPELEILAEELGATPQDLGKMALAMGVRHLQGFHQQPANFEGRGKTTEPIAPAQSLPSDEWIRVKKAIRWSGMSQTKIYNLMSERKIKSASLRERGKARGTRLISFPSLKAFLNSGSTGGESGSGDAVE